jgi:hypothetical protein
MRLSYHPRSRRELKKAAAHYNLERSGLGNEFLEEFDAAARIVAAHGASMAVLVKDVRVVRFKRFPYGIYYRVIVTPPACSRSSISIATRIMGLTGHK